MVVRLLIFMKLYLLHLDSLSLTNIERPFFVTGQVQCLRWEGKVDPFGIETILDLEIDPGGVIQICPIIWRVVPVDDQYVQRVRVEFNE